MPLTSQTLSGDPRLEACLVEDSAHLTPGTRGGAVGKVQAALMFVDGSDIAEEELETQTYGTSTAAAVLAFKRQRQIINRSYQTAADNIVGKMTIKILDDEMAAAETAQPNSTRNRICSRLR